MNKCKKIKIIKVLLIAICFLFFVKPTKATDKIFTLLNIENSYDLNEKLMLPKTVKIDNDEYNSSYYLLTPSKKTMYGCEINFNEIGLYKLKVKLSSHKKEFFYEKNIMVKAFIGSVSSDSSSFHLTDDGLYVNLTEGNIFTLNTILDLSNVTEKDELFKLEINPTTLNKKDFSILKIKFVDILNPNSYIKILLQSSPTNEFAAYALAGATNQPLTGYEKELGRLHRNNEWGSFFPLSFSKFDNASSLVDVRFNALTKEVYAKPGYKIIDLDDPDFFTNRWKGFESSRVRCEISCSSYENETANFTIKSIQNNKVTSSYISDTIAPNIQIDVTNNILPVAVVDKPFKIFEANATDETDGEVEVNYQIFRNYLKTNEYNVSIKDNTFTPDKEGIYTIVYKAIDKAHNIKTRAISIEAKKSIQPLEINLIKSGVKTKVDLGKPIEIANFLTTGGSGFIDVNISVKKDGKNIEIRNNEFIPKEEGTYEVIYEAIDYLGNKEVCLYNVLASRTLVPVFKDMFNLPKYFINNKTYYFNSLTSYIYNNGYEEEVESKVFIKTNNQKIDVTNKDYLINTNEKYLEIIYSVNSYEEIKKIEVINVLENNNLDMSSYFYLENGEKKLTDKGLAVKGNDLSTTFINPLLSGNLSLKLDVSKAQNLDSVDITLTDSINPNQIVRFSFKKYQDHSIFYINNKALYELADCGFTEKSISNELVLDMFLDYVSPFGGINILLATYLDNSIYEGFSSNKVYMNIKANGNGEILIRNVSGQPINTSTKDRIKPEICIFDSYGGEFNINELVSLPVAYALDVLDPNINFSLTVRDPKRNIVKDVNNIKLENVDPSKIYTFKTTCYGNYSVTYEAKDQNNGFKKTMSYAIICLDKEAPIITFNIKSIYKIKEVITISKLNVSDNVTKDLNYIIYLYMPNGKIVILDELKFKLLSKGKYKLAICCYDEALNLGMKDVVFEVK